MGKWLVSGAAAATIDENLAYAGTFSLAGASLAVIKGDALSLSGSAAFGSGALIDGAGVVAVSRATVTALTVGGTATLNDLGTLTQTGAVTLGDATPAAALASIATGATWRIAADVGIGRGESAGSRILDDGLLIKSAGNGVSVVGVEVLDYGVIEAASGTLDFTQSIYASGALKIDAGATLELDAAASSALTLAFNGNRAILALGKPGVFRVAMAGFAAGDTIDLLNTAATSAALAAGDKLLVKNGAHTVATLQLTGDYASAAFTVASDGHGGSAIMVTSTETNHAVVSFAQRMASAGAVSSGGLSAPARFVDPAATVVMLPNPRG